jgi:hypothetical protein
VYNIDKQLARTVASRNAELQVGCFILFEGCNKSVLLLGTSDSVGFAVQLDVGEQAVCAEMCKRQLLPEGFASNAITVICTLKVQPVHWIPHLNT